MYYYFIHVMHVQGLSSATTTGIAVWARTIARGQQVELRGVEWHGRCGRDIKSLCHLDACGGTQRQIRRGGMEYKCQDDRRPHIRWRMVLDAMGPQKSVRCVQIEHSRPRQFHGSHVPKQEVRSTAEAIRGGRAREEGHDTAADRLLSTNITGK